MVGDHMEATSIGLRVNGIWASDACTSATGRRRNAPAPKSAAFLRS
jgi:hypothetical protein